MTHYLLFEKGDTGLFELLSFLFSWQLVACHQTFPHLFDSFKNVLVINDQSLMHNMLVCND